jgi:hypothetical protein
MRTVLLILLAASPAPALAGATREDMVLVGGGRPFYLDIFETTCGEANRVNASCNMSDNNWKPARISHAQAAEYCQRAGKRLPTLDEWMRAASNGGRNATYTLAGDTLYRPDGSLKAAIRGSASVDPGNFNALGIDAVGTVGMTGNRYEWVLGANGAPAMCGGQYETRTDAEVQLPRICVTDAARFAQNATARCAADAAPDDRVTYSARVRGALKDHLAGLPPVIFTPALTPATLDEVLIPRNGYSSRGKDDPSLLEKPKPDQDEDFGP